MGQGSSRIVFLLSSKKVLKLAYDQETGFSKKGIAQNATEVKVFSDQKTHNIVSKIYDHGPKYEFIISELVNTSNKNAIEKYLGIINALDFFGNIEIVKPINLVKEYCVVKAKENLCLQFATSAQNLIADHRLFGDLTIYNHWGFTSDGRLVALDYGFDEEVQDMYANDRFKIPEDPNFSKNTTYK